jgi:hypothetical protein
MSRAGLPPLHLSAMVRDGATAARMAEAGFDSTSAYNVTPYEFDDTRIREETGETRQLFSHEEFADAHGPFNARLAAGSPVPFIPVVSRGWDPSPRCRIDEQFPWRKLQYPYLGIIRDLSPEVFGRCIREALTLAESDPKHPGAILINAWNEYTEGSYLMPDTRHGDAFLQSLREVIRTTP